MEIGVWGLRFEVWCLVFGVRCLRFRVWGFGVGRGVVGNCPPTPGYYPPTLGYYPRVAAPWVGTSRLLVQVVGFKVEGLRFGV